MSLFRGEFLPSFANKVLMYYEKLYCDPNSINDGDIVYCDTHHLPLFKEILNLKKDLILITHNSDHYVCDEVHTTEMGITTNDFICFKRWYARNSYSKRNDVIPIPIGFENTCWEKIFGTKTSWLNDVCLEKIQPDSLVYFNCNTKTNLEERQKCYDFCVKTNFITIDSPNLSYLEYLRNIKKHKFILSPKGNGLDCHRTWEVLKLKRVPIIKREGTLERLYEGMPVLFVDTWYDLHTMNLDELYETFCFENQDYLEINYWLNYCKK